MPSVVLNQVSRSFGSQAAVRDLSFSARAGAVTVVLGPNGAGKTTALRLITGALAPNAGTVEVFGLDPTSADGEAVRRRSGVVTAKPSLYDRLSGLDNLRYAAELYGLGRGRDVDTFLARTAARFGIDADLGRAVGGYSTGMRTRLALARAVIHEPDLLLLDEPTSGLDPESAADVLDLVRQISRQGRTVLLCTHLLAEADGLADEIVVLDRGTAVATGVPDELATRYWPNPQLRLEAQHGPDLDPIVGWPGIVDYARSGHQALIGLDDVDRVSDLVTKLCRLGVRLRAVEPVRPTLEDLYFAIQSALRDGQLPPPSPPPPPSPARTEPELEAAQAGDGRADGPAAARNERTDVEVVP